MREGCSGSRRGSEVLGCREVVGVGVYVLVAIVGLVG